MEYISHSSLVEDAQFFIQNKNVFKNVLSELMFDIIQHA